MEIEEPTRLLAYAFLHIIHHDDDGDAATVGGNPEWFKDARRWLRDYTDGGGGTDAYPWPEVRRELVRMTSERMDG